MTDSILRKSGGGLYSFDIFDTLLVRRCGEPCVLFDLLALTILGDNATDCQVADFALMRWFAECDARQSCQNGEATLSCIYAHADFSRLTDMSNDEIMAVEMQVESQMLVGVEAMKPVVEECRSKGTVCFTSDMYLPSHFLKTVLEREGFFCEGDMLFVSCEYKESKSNGRLYKLVKEQTRCSKFHHFGDNYYSDKVMLRRSVGGKYHRVKHDFTPYQDIMSRMCDFKQVHRPHLLASLSKATLLTEKQIDGHSMLTADLVAPMLVPGVYEIMQRANADGITDLYFLARDGKILYEIAKGFKTLFPCLNIHYLYVSRTSIYVPSIDEITQASLAEISAPMVGDGYTVDQFIETYMPTIPKEKIGHHATVGDVLNDDRLLKEICAYHRTQEDLTFRYIEQCGLTARDAKVGIADLNISGRTVECINKILVHRGHKPVSSYVYMCSIARGKCRNTGVINSLIHTERRTGHNDRVNCLGYIFEDFFAIADHGRTSHYTCTPGGKIAPCLVVHDKSEQEYADALFSEHKRICAKYAENFILTKAYRYNEINIAISHYVLAHFGRNPYREYLTPLCNVKYDNNQDSFEPLIKKMKLHDMVNLLRYRGDYGSWARGSVVVTFGSFGRFMISVLGCLKAWYLANR